MDSEENMAKLVLLKVKLSTCTKDIGASNRYQIRYDISAGYKSGI